MAKLPTVEGALQFLQRIHKERIAGNQPRHYPSYQPLRNLYWQHVMLNAVKDLTQPSSSSVVRVCFGDHFYYGNAS